ncbi:MAG TPA: hypothetical protein VF495_25395, partial [Phenylobacterium sp.]
YEGWRRAEMEADFAQARDLEINSVWLDRRHKRRVEMFVGQGFSPRPRDAATGLPAGRPATEGVEPVLPASSGAGSSGLPAPARQP